MCVFLLGGSEGICSRPPPASSGSSTPGLVVSPHLCLCHHMASLGVRVTPLPIRTLMAGFRACPPSLTWAQLQGPSSLSVPSHVQGRTRRLLSGLCTPLHPVSLLRAETHSCSWTQLRSWGRRASSCQPGPFRRQDSGVGTGARLFPEETGRGLGLFLLWQLPSRQNMRALTRPLPAGMASRLLVRPHWPLCRTFMAQEAGPPQGGHPTAVSHCPHRLRFLPCPPPRSTELLV